MNVKPLSERMQEKLLFIDLRQRMIWAGYVNEVEDLEAKITKAQGLVVKWRKSFVEEALDPEVMNCAGELEEALGQSSSKQNPEEAK